MTTSDAKGIFATDIIVRTALKFALDDLRRNPWLLDYIFAWLIEDSATAASYGDKEVQRAKEWFLKTEIPVRTDWNFDGPEQVSITVSIVDSVEAETTVGDTHYQPAESVPLPWPPLTVPFTSVAYDPPTGALELPKAIGDAVFVIPGMLVVDRSGGPHPVLTVTDRYHITIAANVNSDLTGSVLKGQEPQLVQSLESVSVKESVRIGTHVLGEPFLLIWLHAITAFCLLRYKETLLEGRGFERSTTAWGPFAKDERFGVENAWTRFATLTGYSRWSWPKNRTPVVTSVGGVLQASAVGTAPDVFIAEPGDDDPAWVAGKP